MVEAATKTGSLEGRRLGRYRLRYAIAKGGMATVYLAQLGGAHGFEQWVAIKVMHPHLGEDRRFVTMFLDEAHVASRIRHPNTCAVLDFGEQDGMPYIVMEYLHGETLAVIGRHGWQRGAELPPWVPARLVADAARGLHAAHELRGTDGKLRNLVHRDVSPQNILALYDGVAKMMDFGVAQAEDRLTDTVGREVKGKFAYMSPEQLRGQPLDRRSDVWALGVVLWETTVGRRLFRADSAGETTVAVLEREIPSPTELRPGYPPDLADVVMAALQRDAARRTPTAKEVADGLERYLHGTGRLIGADQVAEWMGECFAERRARREELLVSAREPTDLDLESPPADLQSESSLGRGFAHSAVVPTEARATRRPALLLAAMLALAVAGGAGVALLIDEDPAPAPATVARADTSAPRADRPRDVEPESAPPPEPEPVEAPSAVEEPRTAERPDEAPIDAPRARERRSLRGRSRAASPSASSEGTTRGPPGTLNLLAIPAAEVFLGRRSLGRTPLMGASLPAGTHRLRLVPIGGGEPRSVAVVIRPGERTSRSVSLATLD